MCPPGPEAGNDRRSDQRYKVSFRVRWWRDEKREEEAEVTDLSAGGCFVRSQEEVMEDDLVKLRLNVPGHEEVTIWGNVAYWIDGAGFGVRFPAFSQGGARELLKKFLDTASRD